MVDYWSKLKISECWSNRKRFNYLMQKINDAVAGDSDIADLINNIKVVIGFEEIDTEKGTLNSRINSLEEIEVPVKTSDLENDSGFISEHQSLEDYITKSDTVGLITNTGEIDTTTYLSEHQSLEDYITKSDTVGLVKNDGTIDVNEYLTEHQDISGKLDKSEVFSNGVFTTKTTNSKGTVSQIWNESDGGGTLITDGTSNVKAFTGVNEGGTGTNIYVQSYAIDKTSKVGTRISLNPDGAYYTNGDSKTFTSDDEIVTKKDLEELIARIEALEN